MLLELAKHDEIINISELVEPSNKTYVSVLNTLRSMKDKNLVEIYPDGMVSKDSQVKIVPEAKTLISVIKSVK